MSTVIKNIAIVDDDEGTRRILAKYLADEPEFKTTLFSSGNELLEYMEENVPDAILLDIEMPGISGIHTFDKLRDNGSWADVPVIFLTGKEDKSTVLKCIGKGADAYIVKPVSKDNLINKIKEVLERLREFKRDKVILMVDDDAEFLKIAKIKLSRYFKVLTVNSGKTALDYLSSHKVDLIILDYFMPLYDGNSILNILKHRKNTADIPVIMVSSLKREEIMIACGNNPPDGAVTKPVNMEDLLTIIRKMLDK